MSDTSPFVKQVASCAFDAIHNADEGGKRQRARAYFAAWEDLLKSDEEIPPALKKSLSELLGYLARGIIPQPMTDCVGPGQPVGPNEEADLRVAVTYVLAVKHKILSDPSPIKTVMTAYGLRSRNSVQEWVKRYTSSIAIGEIPNGETLVRQLEASGQRYAQAGRTHAANRAKQERKVPT